MKTRSLRVIHDYSVPIIFFIGFVAMASAAIGADRLVRNSIIERAELMALAVDTSSLGHLTGTLDDSSTEEYLTFKGSLMKLREQDPLNVRFVYVMGQKNNQLFFYGDSEPHDSPDVSPPGQLYEEAPPEMKQVILTQRGSYSDISHDRWGTWVSATVPLTFGDKKGLLGLDMDFYRTYLPLVGLAMATPFFAMLLGIGLIQTNRRIRREQERSLDEKAEIMSVVAHEIRSPLAGILWATEGLLRSQNYKLSDALSKRIREVHTNASTVYTRINNLLALQKLERTNNELEFSPVNVSDLTKRAVSLLALVMEERNITFAPSLPEDKEIYADKDRFFLALSNGISNAVKYALPRTEISVDFESKGKTDVITISNRSEPLEVENVDRYFTYHRSKHAEAGAGDGLGLPLVRRIMKLHGGDARLSYVDGHTLLTLTLPRQALSHDTIDSRI